MLALFSFGATGHAATFTVDRTDDVTVSACSSASNDCTLRGAVTKANATAGADTISFSATVFAAPGPHVIALATELPHLTGNTIIIGPGAGRLTVKEGGAGGSFFIFTADIGVSATFSGVSLSNGFSAILTNGTLNTTNCTLNGNGAGIFIDGGTVTVTNCTLNGNDSAGILNYGTVTATNCTLNGNNVGISNQTGTVTATNCTLSGNTADGMDNISGNMMTATNCTISGNAYSGINNSGTARVTNCTISGNAYSGILNDGTAMLKNTLVAGNLTNVQGAFTNGGHNITHGTAAQAGLDSAGLQDNGGRTKTIALLTGSPAIDAGGAGGPDKDQRGLARPYDNPAIANASGGDGSDIGAFELQHVPPTLAVNNPRSLPEGSASSPGSITFDITLNSAQAQSVTVNYQTRDGINNPATAGVDYIAKSGKLTFAPGETLKRVTVFFIGDDKAEAHETFFFDLKTPTNATIGDGRGVGTIVNDDATPQLLETDESSQ